ncbi:excalibur calcium-binding domain-containing protein [Nodosilinea sp. FACHB-141]|uniref:excalibur calcium-binding domain-containing protein n=1 Tax=Cyanophyceae TaxID=3028117 RepID=UPI0037C8066F
MKMPRFKPTVPAIALIGASLLLPCVARANDYSSIDHYCYMVSLGGEIRSLDHLCPGSAPQLVEASAVAAAVPMAGQVCDDFASWGEAQYHLKEGSAPSSLDDDSDGIACESLRRQARSDGRSVFSNRNTRGDSIEIIRASETEHYLKVNSGGDLFTTRTFPTQDNARDHMVDYYADLI